MKKFWLACLMACVVTVSVIADEDFAMFIGIKAMKSMLTGQDIPTPFMNMEEYQADAEDFKKDAVLFAEIKKHAEAITMETLDEYLREEESEELKQIYEEWDFSKEFIIMMLNTNIDVVEYVYNNNNEDSEDMQEYGLLSTMVNPSLEICSFFYSQCIIEDLDGMNHLMFSAMNSNTEILEFFLTQGFDINSSDKDGNTALFYAATVNENPEATRMLLEHGAFVNAVNGYGRNAFILTCATSTNTRILELLIDYGIDTTHKDNEGNGAKDYAEVMGNSEVLEFLKAKNLK
ncbi:MAG: ankyrin repeat domain-containing protein [Spirochaetales bacterium]|nr:ankyrin repeat domain-containing protein [Spirochaetales bacterium]